MCVCVLSCFHVLSLLVLPTLKVFCCDFFFFLIQANQNANKIGNKMQIVLAIFLAVKEMDLLTACVADVGLQSLLKPIFKII